MVIPDHRTDERFADLPHVLANEDPVLFYSGVPLVSPRGLALGTLCVIDNKSRELSDSQRETLLALSR